MARVAFRVAAFGMVLLAAQTARAQTVGGSASGGVSGGSTASIPPPPAPTTPPDNPPPTVATTSAASNSAGTPTPAVASAKEAEDSNTPDHETLIGHFGVGYMGISQLPIGGVGAGAGGGALTRNTVTAPVIGIRYWLNRMIGIDGGIGFGLASGGTSVNNGTTTTDTDSPSSLGFALHGGVPLAFAHGKHYSFELVPELNFGLTSGTIKAAAAGAPDTDLSGFRIDAGARVGAEIYFGFIGIPQLALQASVGAYFTHQSWKVSVGNASASQNVNSIGTSVQSDPWALFANNISALYYF